MKIAPLRTNFLLVPLMLTALLGLSNCQDPKDEIGPVVNLEIIDEKLDINNISQGTILISNVTLIANVLEEAQPGMDVFIRDGMIESIQESGSELDADVKIDGEGKFLMPGLSDMHTHPVTTGSSARNDLFLFLASGVTTIRVMWGFLGHVALRDSINRGELLGPNMSVASPGFVGTNDFWRGAVQSASTTEVQALVQEYADANFDFIKVYSGLPLDQYDALVEKANEVGIVPIGHIPNGVSLSQVLEGHRSIEHLGSVNGNYDVIATTARSNAVWFCPTITVGHRSFNEVAAYKNQLYYRALSADFKEWMEDPISQPVLSSTTSFVKSLVNKTGDLHAAGAPIISGTDMGIRYVLPGISLHKELEFYVEAGMTPAEALATSTLNAHKFLGDENDGKILVGNKADLVLLDSNPLDNISNVRETAGVIKSGYYFSKEDIDDILEALAASGN